MITVELLQSIDRLLPGADGKSLFLRKLVRLLADTGGELKAVALFAATGGDFAAATIVARSWDGLRWSGEGREAVVRLAPWVRKAVGLPVDAGELLADLGDRDDEDEPSAYFRPVQARMASILANTSAPLTPQAAAQLADAMAHDPLADVRAALARCRNVSTPAEALEHALPYDGVRVRIADQ